MPPPARSVAPETFLLDQDAQQSLPPDSVVALQQVDNRTSQPAPRRLPTSFPTLRRSFPPCAAPPPVYAALPHPGPSRLPPAARRPLTSPTVKYFLISAPVDWQPDQYIRRFLLPTGEYVSCVLW